MSVCKKCGNEFEPSSYLLKKGWMRCAACRSAYERDRKAKRAMGIDTSDKRVAKPKSETNADIDELREYINYDPMTGIAIWKKQKSNAAAIGNLVGTVRKGYYSFKFDRRDYFLHRAVWAIHYGEWPATILDHINRNSLDNRIGNLRLATILLNCHNRKNPNLRNSCGLLGVRYLKKKRKYISIVRFNHAPFQFGFFDSAQEAHNIYLKARTIILDGLSSANPCHEAITKSLMEVSHDQ